MFKTFKPFNREGQQATGRKLVPNVLSLEHSNQEIA
jgi:hypothetical protein